MNLSAPATISETNLSRAWARAFLHIMDHPGTEIAPLLVTMPGAYNGQIPEDESIRKALDSALRAVDEQEVHTVANTIFPEHLWRLAQHDRQLFYQRYLAALPRYVALAKSKNHRGLYFARLIAYGIDPATGQQLPHVLAASVPQNGNQLEHIITQYRARPAVRRSMLQASVFDPARDHVTSAQLGFPCLQHLTFVPHKDGTLTINAFYATQQIFEKAYGNFLGICRLGHFMATGMGLQLGYVHCFVGIEKLDQVRKTSAALTALIDVARAALLPSAEVVNGAAALV